MSTIEERVKKIVVEQLGLFNKQLFHLVGKNVLINVDVFIMSIIIHVQQHGHHQQHLIYLMLHNGKINMQEVIRYLVNLNIDFYLKQIQILNQMKVQNQAKLHYLKVGKKCMIIKVEHIMLIIYLKQLNGKIQDEWIVIYLIFLYRMVLKCV